MIPKRFEEQVKRTPHRTALKTEEEFFTYEELNQYANRVAHLISGTLKQTGTVERVSLLFDHGLHMIAAILGVLKAGRAYVPLSTDYPDNRLSYMIENSESSLVLTLSRHEGRTRKIVQHGNSNIQCLSIDRDSETLPEENLGIDIPANQLAYIMYTSGSTGRPKGVMQNHGNVLYYISNWTRIFSITNADRMTLFSSFCHDGSVQDMLGALLNGATLYPVNVRDRQDTFELSEFLVREKITIWHSVHSLFSYFANTLTGEGNFEALRFILLGGEAIREHEINMFKKFFPHSILANVYGQTESSVDSIWIIQPKDTIEYLTIGEPLDCTRIFVLDKNYSEVEEFEVGEIIVACPHVSPGYWKDEEASAKTFSSDDKFGILYFTGDLGRLLPDGKIEFKGRRDSQVKLRGFRIELGEIENQLLKHPAINEAVVMAKEIPLADVSEGSRGNKDKYLCAYIVPKSPGSQQPLQIPGLKAFLAEELPDYMVPTFFITLERLPLTQSGKIDRKALPEPEIGTKERYAPPRDQVEEKLVEIWQEVLGVNKEEIGIDADFFELGGHSLRGTAMLSKIHKELNVQIPVAKIFQISTVRGLAEYIRKAVKEQYIPIEFAAKKEYYAASSMQKRLFILNEIEGVHTAYNLKSIMHVEGELDYRRLEQAFKQLLQRHESLRTSFELREDKLVQIIHDTVGFEIEHYEALSEDQGVENSDKNAKTRQVLCAMHFDDIIKDFVRPFDLSRAPLLRAGLIKAVPGSASHILMIDTHHIVFDGTSLMVFLQEFLALYAGEELPSIKIQYKDYSEWLNGDKKRESIKEQEEYWLNQFTGEIPVLELPSDYKRPVIQSFAGHSLDFSLAEKETKALQYLALREGATLYMVLLALLNLWLSKLSGQEDIIVGTGVAGRRHVDIQDTIGLFVNTLAIRNYPRAEKRFLDFLHEVKERTVKAFENQECQFEDLVDKVEVNRDVSRNPLFDVMFAFQNIEVTNLEIPGLKLSPYKYERSTTIFDLNLQGYVAGEELKFILGYCTKLFEEETIERFIYYFKEIVFSLIENFEKKISEVEIVSEKEKRQLLYDFINTPTDYAQNKTIQQLFTEQTERTPDNIAVICNYEWHETGGNDRRAITYRELDKKANKQAVVLIGRGVGPDSMVGIMLEPCIEMIVGILAILKAGGAYVPIEPGYPAERIDYMLRDGSVKVLLTTRDLSEKDKKPEMWDGETIFLEVVEKLRSFDIEEDFNIVLPNFSKPLSSSSLAYVIYTSGSTGSPKGVMVEHRSAVNVLFSLQDAYPMSPGDRYLLKTSFIFDVSVTELFGWFFGGSRLVIMGEDERKEPQKIIDVIESAQITHINFVPSLFGAFLELLDFQNIHKLSTLKYIFLAGEALSPQLVKRFRSLRIKVMLENLYGPTEGTVYASGYSLSHWDGSGNVPIGRPLSNIKLYILDRGGHLQPIRISGELTISGNGVARGYLNNPELTDERFLEDPFAEGNRLYRTGDLTHWLPDRNIAFWGRLDHQVKIRGFRVELGEIEYRLLECEGIKEAVVVLKSDSKGDNYLCAYIVDVKYSVGAQRVVPSSSRPIDQELREYLSRTLPDYMIPSFFVRLEKIPLTSSGKVDRKALPKPEIGTVDEHIAPRNEIEERLVEMWAKVLGIKPDIIGIDSNFFHLGGHSLKATILAAQIEKKFNIKFPLSTIFQDSTIKSAANFIKKARQCIYEEIKPVEKKDNYPLSSAQKRLFFLDKFENIGVSYNFPRVLKIEGEVDKNG